LRDQIVKQGGGIGHAVFSDAAGTPAGL
jgi:hypothetical protein